MRARPLLHGMLFTISAARRLGDGHSANSPSESPDASSLQSDAAFAASAAEVCMCAASAVTVFVMRRRRALIRATSAAMRSSPLDIPGDAMERAVPAVLGLGVLLRTTDCSAAANAGDDIKGGDFRAADGVESKCNREAGGGGGAGGGGALDVAAVEAETAGDFS